MEKMVATYERDMTLNVRSGPSLRAEVVRTMSPGERAEVEEIRDGWAKLSDGFAQACYLVVRLAGAVAGMGEAVGEVAGALPGGQPERPGTEAVETADVGEAEELRKMTNPQLYELATQSGIKVKKGATKPELIAAILADV